MSPSEYIKAALRTESEITSELLNRVCGHEITGTEGSIEEEWDERPTRAIHGVFGLQTEIGEYVDGWKRFIFYNKPRDKVNAAEEIGDILWYLAILCDLEGVSFEECMEANIAKLKARYPEKFDSHKAVNRNLDAERQALDTALDDKYGKGGSPLGPSFSVSPAGKYTGGRPVIKENCGTCGSTNVRQSTMSVERFVCQDCGAHTDKQ